MDQGLGREKLSLRAQNQVKAAKERIAYHVKCNII